MKRQGRTLKYCSGKGMAGKVGVRARYKGKIRLSIVIERKG